MRDVLYKTTKDYIVIQVDKVKNITWKHGVHHSLKGLKGTEKFRKLLGICLSDKLTYPYHEVSKTNHLDYFTNYLRYYDNEVGFEAQTIVVEKKYMSLSFLKDYSTYYSSGYHERSKYCRRIHFFQNKFSEQEFENFLISGHELKDNDENKLSNFYLGHIVTKPLPNALIGATLIRCYDEFFDSLTKNKLWRSKKYKLRNRKFTALRWYTVNLFGQPIHFKSLVFQEQDNAVSACATTALWMSFHKLSELFRTKLPAPIRITESAGLNANSISKPSGRIFPNPGLEVSQLIKAIDNLHIDLVSEVFNPRDKANVALERGIKKCDIISPWKIKRYAYAYLRLEIPVLLGYIIVGQNGNHLVTLTGYRFEKNDKKEDADLPHIFPSALYIKCEADRIFRLFSHDDQLGPFAKIGFNHREIQQYISINWKAKNSFNLAAPNLIIAPVLETIRIDYNHVEEFATQFQTLLEKVTTNKNITNRFIWDIYISHSNDYKQELLKSSLNDKVKLRYTQKSFPRFIWIARLNFIPFDDFKDVSQNIKLIDFMIDASETPKGISVDQVFYFNEDFRQNLKGLITSLSCDDLEELTIRIFGGKKHLYKIDQSLRTYESTNNN